MGCAAQQAFVLLFMIGPMMEARIGLVRTPDLWPLIVMTPLRPGEWWLVCCAPAWREALLQLLFTAPVLAFAQTLGEIPLSLLVGLATWWFTLLLLVTGMSTLGATTARRTVREDAVAHLDGFGLSFLLSIAVGIVGGLLWGVGTRYHITILSEIGRWLTRANPVFRAIELIRMGPGAPLVESAQLLWIALGGLGLVAGMRYNWPQTPIAVNSSVVIGDAPVDAEAITIRTGSAPPRCGERPLAWKDYQFIMGGDAEIAGWWIFGSLAIAITFVAGVVWWQHTDLFVMPLIGGLLAVGLELLLVPRLLATERKDHTWDSLRLLPYAVDDHLRTKLQMHARTLPPRLWPFGIACLFSLLGNPIATLLVIAAVLLLWPAVCLVALFFSVNPNAPLTWRIAFQAMLAYAVLGGMTGAGCALFYFSPLPFAISITVAVLAVSYAFGMRELYRQTRRYMERDAHSSP
jgi:uncharacterized membrane protein YsdA (DUF1294 family)